MTTIVVVRKGKEAAIAADTLTTYGNQLESSRYIKNHKKIVRYKDSYFALTGWSASQTVLEDLLSKSNGEYELSSEKEIFNWQVHIHKLLKDEYFLKADKRDTDAFETSRANMLLANPSGIYALSEYRYVKELSRFYAYGSGADYALGAMFAAYDDKSKTAEDIAKIGIKSGAEFDDSTALPMNYFKIKLK
jgi:ATP-dependent protease HslVU (ClpYQ) peptidase subunit